MDAILDFWREANLVWAKGGTLMPVLGLLSLYTYYVAFDLWLRLRTVIPTDLKAFPRERWGAFKGGGRVDRIMRYCMSDHLNPKETRRRFDQVRAGDASYLKRRLRFLMVLATSAPLIGLLGTVIGMLQTFDGLSMQDSYKMDLVASGISQALVTTQAGLLVAIPALAFIHLLQRRKKDWLTCLNRLESLSMRQVSPLLKTS
ncbi:MAG: MotA/TolQ/ExbB proton channel family protein [Opitutae bacterium]|jgi:biopolymer transport protein ExbB|nr:MotA/TolQ/ExbB proton channel family protein [Opitutae bacterium]